MIQPQVPCGLLIAALLAGALGFMFLGVTTVTTTETAPIVEVTPVAPPTPAARGLSCADFPQTCVPLAGGPWAALEAPETRVLDAASEAAPGVVRGITAEGRPFLGHPEAPVQLLLFEDFLCGHCTAYQRQDVPRIIQDFVLAGDARLEVAYLTFMDRERSVARALATICAGEEGALWEAMETLYGESFVSTGSGSELSRITAALDAIGLDGRAVARCVEDGRYRTLLDGYASQATDLGLTGVPALYWRAPGGTWERMDRAPESVAALVAGPAG